jgi:ribosomal RNA assembly protein
VQGRKDAVFPPAPVPSKIDMQIETGEYFLSQEAQRRRAAAEKLEKQKVGADG